MFNFQKPAFVLKAHFSRQGLDITKNLILNILQSITERRNRR